MNSFACFGSSLVKGTIDPNSILAINRNATALTLDSSGTVIGNNLSAIAGYSSTAWGINPTNGNTTFLSLKQNSNNLTTPTSNFTFYIKHAERFYTDSIFGHGYTITSSASSVTSGNSFTVFFYSLYPTISLPYTITGVTSADLSGASLTGNWTSNYQAITYIVSSSLSVSNTFSMLAGTKTLPVLIAPPPPVPVLYLPFSENSVTILGSQGSNFTYSNEPYSALFTTINSKNCVDSNDPFQILFNYNNQNGYTIGFFLYLASANLGGMVFHFNTGTTGANTASRFAVLSGSNELYIYFSGSENITISNLSQNTWIHITLTVTKDGAFNYHLNGVKQLATDRQYYYRQYRRLGIFYDYNNTGHRNGNKYLSNFVYYDKILTQTEISTLYANNGIPSL